MSTAGTEYDKLLDPTNPVPAAPVFAARLNGLLKHLATAESAVAESVKARNNLVEALEKILATNRQALDADKAQQEELASRKATIESKKQEVELSIMRNLATNEDAQSPGDGPSASPGPEPDRPEMEALTPEPDAPKMEALTPPPAQDASTDFYNTSQPHPENGALQSPVPHHPHSPQRSAFPTSAPGIEMLSNIASQYQAVPLAVNGSNKRRRVDSGEEFPDLGGDDGIDADVAEMLRKDSNAS